MSESENPTESFGELERVLGYVFRNGELLTSALTHRSFVNERSAPTLGDNERLEFLGDAVLGLSVAHLLMQVYPERSEGELSKMRSALVSETVLVARARDLDLGVWLFLGRGEESTGGRKKPSLLADAMEALVGAIYLDGGFEAAHAFVGRIYDQALHQADASEYRDHKTLFHERAAQAKRAVRYELLKQAGPQHNRSFTVSLIVDDVAVAEGQGRSKKEAEQAAAKRALQLWVEQEESNKKPA